MKNGNNKIFVRFLGVIIILFFLLFICVTVLYFKMQKEEPSVVQPELITTAEPETIEQVVTKYESTYIGVDGSKIYVNFKMNLFKENGDSNEEYFEKLIADLIKLKIVGKKSFSLIDEEKEIKIIVFYDNEKGTHTIRYNNVEDFYTVVDGKTYMTIEQTKIMDKVNLIPIASELRNLIGSGLFLKSIREGIGEGTELENGYTSYMDGKLLLQIVDYRVKSIIFTEKYEGTVFSQIEVGTPLEKIEKLYPRDYKGSSKDGYLMYRTKDVYVFFYEDEIVIYGYSYFENEFFEEWLQEYLADKDFKLFIERVTNYWINYDECVYDMDIEYAHITYPSRGIAIEIKDNDCSNTILYNNYYLTDYTKSLIKDGIVKLNYDEDYVEIKEAKRRAGW